MTLQKGFKPIVIQPLRVQKIKWAGHRHFRTFLAITVWSGEERTLAKTEIIYPKNVRVKVAMNFT